MSRFIISADTTMDLPMEMIKKHDIRPVASYVNLGEEDLPDWPDLTQKDLFDYVAKSGELPKTSAANPFDYENFFRKIRETDDRPIIHICKTSGASSCYENAKTAAEEVENVYCVDSWGIGSGTGLLVLRAAQSDIEDPEALVEDLNESTGVSTFTYEKLPDTMSIYPVDFKTKDQVNRYLDDWNKDVDIVLYDGTANEKVLRPSERDELTYTDTISLIINVIDTMITIVTTALVIFTSLSLVVSSFMIAVITYISVMEENLRVLSDALSKS